MSVGRWAVVSLVALMTVGAAHAVGVGPGVGPPLPVTSDLIDNDRPAAAYATAHDTFIALWCSQQDTLSWDIWGRAVGADGTLQSTFLVAAVAAERLQDPAVAYGYKHDQYLVAYVRETQTGEVDVLARLISWNGPGWTYPILIDTTPGSYEFSPSVAYNSVEDQFVVVYTSHSAGQSVKAVLVDGISTASSAPQTIAAYSTSRDCFSPDVAYDSANNRYLITYVVLGSSFAVAAKSVSADLTSVPPDMEIASSSNELSSPAVAMGPGESLITWAELGAGVAKVKARRAALDGSPLGPTGGFLIDDGTHPSSYLEPDVGYEQEGHYLVVWPSHEPTTPNGEVLGRIVLPGEDSPADAAFDLDPATDEQRDAAVAASGAGQLLVLAANDPGTPSSDYEIVGYLVSWTVFKDGFEAGDLGAWSFASPISARTGGAHERTDLGDRPPG